MNEIFPVHRPPKERNRASKVEPWFLKMAKSFLLHDAAAIIKKRKSIIFFGKHLVIKENGLNMFCVLYL